VIGIELARRLRGAGLGWTPSPGDRFILPDRDMDDDVFVVSDMVVELHQEAGGRQVMGFNGTTEWALDSIRQDEVLWLPREDQLRELIGERFVRLERVAGGYTVEVTTDGTARTTTAADVESAYAEALLPLLSRLS
jgi:hypothetical protein